MVISELVIHIPGPAVPLERVRVTKRGNFTPQRSRSYRAHVQACARAALLGKAWDIKRRFDLTISWTPQDARRRDASNVAKAVEDSLNQVVWADDSQIDRLFVERLVPSKSKAGLVVIVRPID